MCILFAVTAQAWIVDGLQSLLVPGVATENLLRLTDSSLIALVGIPLRSQGYTYKGKHEDYIDSLYAKDQAHKTDETLKMPEVGAPFFPSGGPGNLKGSVETYWKNQFIMNVAQAVTCCATPLPGGRSHS